MTVSPEDVRAKLEAGRTAIASQLRFLADRIDALPLEDAAEALSWVGGHVERLLREADSILRAQAGHRQS